MKQLSAVLVVFLICAASSFAQDWSKEQKEVWAGTGK